MVELHFVHINVPGSLDHCHHFDNSHISPDNPKYSCFDIRCQTPETPILYAIMIVINGNIYIAFIRVKRFSYFLLLLCDLQQSYRFGPGSELVCYFSVIDTLLDCFCHAMWTIYIQM